MKLVVQVGSGSLEADSTLRQFAKAVVQLVSEGHRITIVFCGDAIQKENSGFYKCSRCVQRLQGQGIPKAVGVEGMDSAAPPPVVERASVLLIDILSAFGVAAFSLCGADGHILRIRTLSSCAEQVWKAEVAAVDPFWLDIISSRRGVPVIENIGLGINHNCYFIDPDQMAGEFAVGWNADALLFLSATEALTNPDGSVVRWLEAEKLSELTKRPAIAQEILSKLYACRYALKHGVPRTRILPISRVDDLAAFYWSKLECGTEVIEQAGVTTVSTPYILKESPMNLDNDRHDL